MDDSRILARQLLEIIPPVMQTLAAELRGTGLLLSPSHFGVMVMLQFRPCNLSELADYQGVSLPTMSSTISKLEEEGLVSRSRESDDRRIVMVNLTAAGTQKLDNIRDIAETRIGSMMQDLSVVNQKTLADGLEILCKIFELTEMYDETGAGLIQPTGAG